jgi:hypothetical protein
MAIIPNSQKTFSVNEGVNTVYGGSASMKALSQWYTMQDITDTVRPYKVYTALLTQSGGDSISQIINEPLVIGVTYKILEDAGPSGWDFTNVGAPNNNIGTYFVATGTTPNSWANAELESNTGAPVVTVLENTIGNIWFTYDGIGAYNLNSNGLFTAEKTFIGTPTIFPSLDINGVGYSIYYFGVNSLTVLSIDSEVSSNGVLVNAPIEIRVYN